MAKDTLPGPTSFLDLPRLDELPPLPPPTTAVAPRIDAKTRQARARAERGESSPLPPLPPDATWVASQVRNGTLPPETLDEAVPAPRRRGRPSGSTGSKQLPSPGILDAVAQGRTLGRRGTGRDRYANLPPTDDEVSADEWQRVYEAFGETGNPAEICRKTAVQRSHVTHLLDYGIVRLGLPPIREHATDYSEVNLRTAALVRASAPPGESEFLENLPDIKKAVTERATREAAVAQGLLHSSMRTVDMFLGYVNEMMESLRAPDGGFQVPQKVNGGHLETLSKTANNLSRALDTAVRLSRFTAGEPEANIALSLSHLVVQMTPDEIRAYLKTRQLPKHIVNPTGASLTPADEQQKRLERGAGPRIIDADSDEGNADG